ncbi:MAG: glycosyltransferase [Ignavibacteriales bacterium]|nr:glycosyltransferase [Ignavibacteriales bacterium]
MKILTVMMKYDYGVEQRGYSYEYYNVHLPLCDVAGENNVILFDFFVEFNRNGKAAMNKRLKELIKIEKPDLSIFCLFRDEFDDSVLDEIRSFTETVAYFFDDPWRQDFVRRWIKHFNYFTTSDYYSLMNYYSEGIENVIHCPFGYNENIYKKFDVEKKYDVSFVGGQNGYRSWLINILKKNKINVNVFGRDWNNKGGWITQEEMVMIFNQSKINLNLSNNFSKDYRFLLYSLSKPRELIRAIKTKKYKEMVKGRHFEINACGGFQLSFFAPALNLVYEIDKEIAVYEDISSIADHINFFLNNESIRNKIALKGYERSQNDHSAQKYLKNLINTVIGA